MKKLIAVVIAMVVVGVNAGEKLKRLNYRINKKEKHGYLVLTKASSTKMMMSTALQMTAATTSTRDFYRSMVIIQAYSLKAQKEIKTLEASTVLGTCVKVEVELIDTIKNNNLIMPIYKLIRIIGLVKRDFAQYMTNEARDTVIKQKESK